jgi:hypothetical protein
MAISPRSPGYWSKVNSPPRHRAEIAVEFRNIQLNWFVAYDNALPKCGEIWWFKSTHSSVIMRIIHKLLALKLLIAALNAVIVIALLYAFSNI